MDSSQKERMIPMLKKLTALSLSLSLLLCLSLLPGQASAMDAPENEPPVQTEDVENQDSPNDADAGIASYRATIEDLAFSGGGGSGSGGYFGFGSFAKDQHGNRKG